MAGAPTATLDAALNRVGELGVWLSLHIADPDTTGANEVIGGTPAYARKATVWNPASSGLMTGSTQTLDIPPNTTIGWYGVWSAATGGDWITGGPLRDTANTENITESFTNQGQYALTPKITADNIAVT